MLAGLRRRFSRGKGSWKVRRFEGRNKRWDTSWQFGGGGTWKMRGKFSGQSGRATGRGIRGKLGGVLSERRRMCGR